MTGAATPAAPRPLRSRARVIMTALIGVISVVSGVVGIYATFARDPSNFSHLRVAAAPVSDGAAEWALPPDAPLATFPAPGRDGSCGAEQRRWLAEHGREMSRRFQVELRNAATEGPSLALVDFRTAGETAAERGQPLIRVLCSGEEQPPETVSFARLDADTRESTARTVTLRRGEGQREEQLPLIVNVAPGESAQTRLELFARSPAAGGLTVTVLSGEEERVVPIEGIDFSLPALLFSGEMYLVTGPEGLRCERIDGGSILPCTLEELLFEAATARQN